MAWPAVLLNRVLQAGISQTRAADPIAYLIAAALFLAIALLASYQPVRAATRVDPIEALRE